MNSSPSISVVVPELTDEAIESMAEILVGALLGGELDSLLSANEEAHRHGC